MYSLRVGSRYANILCFFNPIYINLAFRCFTNFLESWNPLRGSFWLQDYEFIDFVADKVPELQVERGAGISYIAGQLFKCLGNCWGGVSAEELGQRMSR